MFPLVEKYEQGTWSQDEFCKNNKLKKSTLQYWLSKYRKKNDRGRVFIPVGTESMGSHGFRMELEMTNGVVLRFSDLIPRDYIEMLLTLG